MPALCQPLFEVKKTNEAQHKQHGKTLKDRFPNLAPNTEEIAFTLWNLNKEKIFGNKFKSKTKILNSD